jgi:hypothetical protein
MGTYAKGKAVDIDTGRTLYRYPKPILQGKASDANKWATKFGYDVIDIEFSFFEPDMHQVVFYLRKRAKKKR